MFGIAFVLLCVASARGAEKKIDVLGLDLIDWIKPVWSKVQCSEWPEKDGSYKCNGTFFVHPQGIKAKKSEN